MQARTICSDCKTTGLILNNDPYSAMEIVCERCGGAGYHVSEILFPEYDILIEKLDAIKEVVDQIKIKTKA
jgi:hypothetical protein